jgi:hypothetical protein
VTRVKFVLVLSVAALLAGCTGNVSGNALPSTDQPQSSPTLGDGVNVPKVEHPLDTTRYEQKPCDALSAEQLSQLGIATAPRPDVGNKLGPGCEWNAYDDAGLTVGARILTAGSSLAKLYLQHEQGAWPYFKPVSDVAGYPGVLMDGVRAVPNSTCDLSVAVRDDLIYSVQVRIDPKKEEANDPCPVVQRIAELAVSTMKAGV